MGCRPASASAIYELRHYVPAEGRAAALRERFSNVSFRLFERHGFDVAGFWVEPRSGDLWYLLRWPDDRTRKAGWAAFLKDDDWCAALEQSERDGPLAAKIESIKLDEWP